MRVFITGGSGFVGREVVAQLTAKGYAVRVLIRSAGISSWGDSVETVVGDTTQEETLKEKMAGCDAVIHLVGIIREFPGKGITFEKLHTKSTENIVKAAHEQGVQRHLQMSANGTREQAKTGYHRTKWAAEEQVRRSNLDWTIFRPSLIYGPGDEFVNMLARMIKLAPIVPVFGDGQYLLQPVHVSNVASAFVDALEKPDSIGNTYCCCGPDTLSYDQILDRIGSVINLTRIRKIHQPLSLITPLVKLFQSCSFFPITSDQLTMLIEGNTCDDDRWLTDFNIKPARFESSIHEYLTKKSPAETSAGP